MPRAGDDNYVYRVHGGTSAIGVLAQMALYETQIVELPQVFLPFAMASDGSTLYDQINEGKFLLGDGS